MMPKKKIGLETPIQLLKNEQETFLKWVNATPVIILKAKLRRCLDEINKAIKILEDSR